MEDTLGGQEEMQVEEYTEVLILVLMEDTLGVKYFKQYVIRLIAS